MPPRKRIKPSPSPSPFQTAASTPFTRPADPVYYSYSIGRGEQLVLTYEPYKSYLLPLWRFKDPQVARESSERLWEKFREFREEEDFVGMDMTRKFIQMGMTRAGRYANRPGGRKYSSQDGSLLEKSTSHPDSALKAESSRIFREIWGKCKRDEEYERLKGVWTEEKKKWRKEHPDDIVEDVKSGPKDGRGAKKVKRKVKEEGDSDEEAEEKPERKSRRKVKNEDED